MKSLELATPTSQQRFWQDLELGMFCHFGINTFHDQEWGEGNDSPQTFNPTSLDAKQWVKVAKDAGFKYLILTAKHHDGFCLWPTETTDYSVKSSPWKNGKGDVVREVAEACQEEGMLFGLYLSPWDRHEPCYEDKEVYDDFYCQQLTELLTGYGPLVELWFDGAGSQGREYDWQRIIGLIKEYQPDAMIFNMGQPTIRWVGNEDGVAPYPCWNTAKTAKLNMFTSDMLTWMEGTPEWVPAECDVPIRKKHWFWHPKDEHSLLTLDELMNIYYRSVGHGTNLLLNVAPDTRGLLPDVDAKRLIEFGTKINTYFSNPLGECSGEGNELTIELPAETEIDHVVVMEDITYGERVREYRLEAKVGETWVSLGRGSAIGHKKIDKFNPISTNQIRIIITESVATPNIKSLTCFNVGSNK